jgi:glycosyltransferase involved in cell wall biosynthesis
MTPDVSIVVPVYRNAATLRELHARIVRAVASLRTCEILFVDDACPAHSLDVLRALCAEDPRCGVIVHAHNMGQNRAVLTGLQHARADIVVTLDADLQDPPEAIPLLLDALTGDVAVVFAGRRGRYESRFRLAGSRVFRWLRTRLSSARIPADAGLFLAMTRAAIEALLELNDPQPYVVGMIGRTRLRVASVPVLRAANPLGASGYDTRKRIILAAHALAPLARMPRAESALRRAGAAAIAERIGCALRA